MQPAETIDFIQYRGRFENPFLLTFELYPPLTAEQCQFIAEKHNVNNPNELAEIMALEGVRPSRLIQIKLDEATLARQAAKDIAVLNFLQSLQPSEQIQQIWQEPDLMGDIEEYSSNPLFDSRRQPRYFRSRNNRIIGLDGSSVSWVDDSGNVYDYQGNHKGWFSGGYIRGHDGGVITWQRSTQGLGVIPPIPEIPPIPPIPKVEPIRPIPSIPPIKPIPKLGWSDYDLK